MRGAVSIASSGVQSGAGRYSQVHSMKLASAAIQSLKYCIRFGIIVEANFDSIFLPLCSSRFLVLHAWDPVHATMITTTTTVVVVLFGTLVRSQSHFHVLMHVPVDFSKYCDLLAPRFYFMPYC